LLFAFPAEFADGVLAVSAEKRQILVKDFRFSGLVGLPVISDLRSAFFSAMVNPTYCLQALYVPENRVFPWLDFYVSDCAQ
jgi:hypothetical protein